MSKDFKVLMLANYQGHTIKNNGSIALQVKVPAEHLDKAIQLLAHMQSDFEIVIQHEGETVKPGSVFKLNMLKVDKDGNATIKLLTIDEYANINELNKIITQELFKIKFSAKNVDED